MDKNFFKLSKTAQKGVYSMFDGAYLIAKGNPDWAKADGRYPITQWHIYREDGTMFMENFRNRMSAHATLRVMFKRGELPESPETITKTYYVKSRPAWGGGGRPGSKSYIQGAMAFFDIRWTKPTVTLLCLEDGMPALDEDNNIWASAEITLIEAAHEDIAAWIHESEYTIEILDDLPLAEDVHIPTTPEILLKEFEALTGMRSSTISWDGPMMPLSSSARYRVELWAKGSKEKGCELFAQTVDRRGNIIASASRSVDGPDPDQKDWYHWNEKYAPKMRELEKEIYDNTLSELRLSLTKASSF